MGRGICRLCRRDAELHTLVYLLLVVCLWSLEVQLCSLKSDPKCNPDALDQFRLHHCTCTCVRPAAFVPVKLSTTTKNYAVFRPLLWHDFLAFSWRQLEDCIYLLVSTTLSNQPENKNNNNDRQIAVISKTCPRACIGLRVVYVYISVRACISKCTSRKEE